MDGMNSSVRKLSSGSKATPGSDIGALSMSLKLASNKSSLSAKMNNVQNAVSFLQAQSEIIHSARSILERIADLKIRFDDPTLNVTDRSKYDLEFRELSDQLESLKFSTFNGLSIFSNPGSGSGLFESTRIPVDNANLGSQSAVTKHVLDYEDIRYINEAGEALKKGFGGLDVVYFPSSDSQKQTETITISGNIAEGDEFYFNLLEQTALLETESDSSFYFLASSATESATDPQAVVRDDFYNQLTASSTVTEFVDIEKVGSNQIKLTAKMKGDPYLVHSYGSTGSSGSMKSVSTGPASRNDTQEDRVALTLPGVSLFVGDSIAVDLNGSTFRYTHDQNNNASSFNALRMLRGLRDEINSSSNFGAYKYTSGWDKLMIYDKDRGGGFTSSNLTLNLSSSDASNATDSLTGSVVANRTGAGVFESIISVGPDDKNPGGGSIPVGDKYRVRIQETHPDEIFRYDKTSGNNTVSTTTSYSSNQQNAIRDALYNKLDNLRTQSEFLHNGSPVFQVQKIGDSQIGITGTKVGDSFSVSAWVNAARDSLSKSQDAENISPFSIEKSIEYLNEMLSQNNAEQDRLNRSHSSLQDEYLNSENAISRIEDADYAAVATEFAKKSLNLKFAENAINRSIRITDLLIPLTTDHFRGSALQSSL